MKNSESPQYKGRSRGGWLARAFATTVMTTSLVSCAPFGGEGSLAKSHGMPAAGKNQAQQIAAEGFDQLSSGETGKAKENFSQALRLSPGEASFHLLNAISYHMEASRGNEASFALAQEGYKQAIKNDPSNWLGHYMLGRLLLDTKQYSAARESFSEALLLNPEEKHTLRAMAFASYSDGDPAMAASMIERLEQKGKLVDSIDFRNAAVIFAAVGEKNKATEYQQKYAATDSLSMRKDQLDSRIRGWESFHQNAGDWTAPENFVKAGMNDATGYGEPMNWGAADPNKMVVVDVVIIRAEESIGTSKGVNLLNGLKVQFGSGFDPAYMDQRTRNITNDPLALASRTTTDVITRTISVPALDYSLNIFNSNNNRNEILARPTIVAMVGQPSSFFSGVEINAAAVSSADAGEPVQIDKAIGVFLSVTPEMLDDDRVKLKVSAERTFLKSPSNDVNFTFKVETSKTTVNSNVVMRFGETLILSGLSEKESQNTRDGVPLLQDIPLLQYFFSNEGTTDFQRSVLILLTPRPANYVYQSEEAAQKFQQGLTEDERAIADLRAQYSDWFKPYPNWASVFKHMQDNKLYREFRTGDVELEDWASNEVIWNRLRQSAEFLWY